MYMYTYMNTYMCVCKYIKNMSRCVQYQKPGQGDKAEN